MKDLTWAYPPVPMSGQWNLSGPDSTELFIEDQGFSPPYKFGSFPPPLPAHLITSVSSTSVTHSKNESQLADGIGDGGGAKAYDGEKAWSSINHSILSGPEDPLR